MKKQLAWLLVIAASLAQGQTASPLIWRGTYAYDITSGGVRTTQITLPENRLQSSTDYVAIAAPGSVTGNYTLTLPGTDGSIGQVLYNVDGSGELGWEDGGVTPADLNAAKAAISAKQPVDLLCHANIALTGVQTCDGQPTSSASRVLLVAQTDFEENGIWSVSDFGAWARPADFPSPGVIIGSLVPVTDGGGGTTYSRTFWMGYGDGSTVGNYYQVPTSAANTKITASKVVVTDASSYLTAASTSTTQVNYLSSATGTTGTASTNLVFSASPTLTTPILGTPQSVNLSNGTALPLSSGVSGTLPIGNGGTGQITASAAFDALSPMTTAGDIIYGGTSGTGTRLAKGTSVQLLHSGTTPTWSAVSLTADVTGVLPIANGGSNKALTLAAGGLLWTDADSFEVGAAGTASDWALSGGTGAPTFSSTTTTAKVIDGSADAIQLTVQGNGTQTSDILVAEKSDGTDLLEVTNTLGTKIRGTTTAADVAAGFVGEFLESAVGASNFGASNTFLDFTTLTLTAGDWDVSGRATFLRNGATFSSVEFFWEMITATGNSTTGGVYPQNRGENSTVTAITFDTFTAVMSPLRVTSDGTNLTVAGTTTAGQIIRLKGAIRTYSSGTPQFTAYLSARRVR